MSFANFTVAVIRIAKHFQELFWQQLSSLLSLSLFAVFLKKMFMKEKVLIFLKGFLAAPDKATALTALLVAKSDDVNQESWV